MNKLFKLLILLTFIPPFLFACSADGIQWQSFKQSTTNAMIEPGDKIDNMVFTTDAEDAPPLWAYCSASEENKQIRTFHCRAPVRQTLAVGHLFLLADAALLNQIGTGLVWELAIDDTIVDLASFGTFDYVMPTMASSPSLVREVFARVTDWDLVMTSLNPGEHVLQFRAQNGAAQYHWLVYLVIEPTDNVDIISVSFPLHS